VVVVACNSKFRVRIRIKEFSFFFFFLYYYMVFLKYEMGVRRPKRVIQEATRAAGRR